MPQNAYGHFSQFGYGSRPYWFGYYPPSQQAQFQQRYPYDEESYYYSILSNPEAYRWVFEITKPNLMPFNEM